MNRRVNDRVRRGARAACALLTVVGAVLGTWWFFTHWDPTRNIWKRSSQRDPYRYEQTDPRFLEIDLAALLQVTSDAAVDATRQRLIAFLWEDGHLPIDARPAAQRTVYEARQWSFLDRLSFGCPSIMTATLWDQVCLTDVYGGMRDLERIEFLHIPVSTGYIAIAARFTPTRPNGRLVVFHQGLAGTYHDQFGHIRTLLGHGYAVIAFNQPLYGDYEGVVAGYHDAPLKMFVEPVIIAINDAVEQGGYDAVDMVGFSSGAWVTVLAAAVDSRIRNSYAVAGVLPAPMRRPSESAPPQLRPELLATVSYLDLFVLGASGAGRGQLHIFNRFDSCCFDGTRSLLYAPIVDSALSRIGSGRFAVVIDETHSLHKISRLAMQTILADMARP